MQVAQYLIVSLLNGAACDTTATQAAIEQAHTTAQSLVGNACIDVEFTSMGYATIFDMYADVDIFCQELQNAMVSAVYGPAMQRGVIQPVDDDTRACIAATTRIATRLLQPAFRTRERFLDLIATTSFPPSQKFALLRHSTMNIQKMEASLQATLKNQCPNFANIYQRSAATFLSQIGSRADCLSSRTYVQDYVVCPDSVCGNGIQESSEQCDDGNITSGDGCSADCQKEMP